MYHLHVEKNRTVSRCGAFRLALNKFQESLSPSNHVGLEVLQGSGKSGLFLLLHSSVTRM